MGVLRRAGCRRLAALLLQHQQPGPASSEALLLASGPAHSAPRGLPHGWSLRQHSALITACLQAEPATPLPLQRRAGGCWDQMHDVGSPAQWSRCFSSSPTTSSEDGEAAGPGTEGAAPDDAAEGAAEEDADLAEHSLPGVREMRECEKAKLEGTGGMMLTKEEKKIVLACLERFANSSWVQNEALELYVNAQMLVPIMAAFRKLVRRGITPELRDALCKAGPGKKANKILFGIFADMVFQEYKAEVTAYRKLVQSADLRLPHSWYPLARSMRRKLIYHGGPTNSGKTHNALVAMAAAESGVYCGPLRLLAMEVFDKANADGLYCSLVTGQEKQIVPGARHVACTIEMASTTEKVDVAVLDEIQMLGDPYRGWAWTRALQGIPASEIHLCGDLSALQLVKHIAKEMGDELVVNTYDRFTKLEVEPQALEANGGYSQVQPGDCVVAFSRRDIYAIKSLIEAETGLRVCVVYGALPPEMRRIQAQLFNDPESGYDVMVASDAVGMGLNLNIRRIIFHALQKFEGTETAPVSVSMIKQIGGRAGRRSSEFSKGFVTCFRENDMAALREALAVPISKMNTPQAGLFPEFEQIELFASQIPRLPFPALLRRFAEESRLDGKFFFCKQDPLILIAKLLDSIPDLSLKDRYDFCTAPVNARDQTATAHLLRIATEYCRGEACSLELQVPDSPPSTNDELAALESQHHLTSLWLVLAQRFGTNEVFLGREETERTAARIVTLMSEALAQMSQSGIDRTLPKSLRLRSHRDLLAPHTRHRHAHGGRGAKKLDRKGGGGGSSSHRLLASLNRGLRKRTRERPATPAENNAATAV